MCELTVYMVKGKEREKVMEGVVQLTPQDGKVLLKGIFGEAKTVKGRLADVDIISQVAGVIAI